MAIGTFSLPALLLLFAAGTFGRSGLLDESHPEYWMSAGRAALNHATSRRVITQPARNLILFVGDGMGVSTLTAARILKGQLKGMPGEETQLSFEEFPNVGLSKTYSLDFQTTDSAATATALLTGVKTNRRSLGVDGRVPREDCEASLQYRLSTVLDWALESGRSVGIVTTTRLTHATPAAAYSHVPERGWEGDVDLPENMTACKDIAAQLIDENPQIQVLLGGGRRHFMHSNQSDPETQSSADNRQDGRDLIQDWISEKESRGMRAHYVWNATAFDAVNPDNTDFLLGLFQPSHMNYELDRTDNQTENEAGEPSLAEMVDKAIRILQKNPKGFFLLAEGGRIDHGHHDNMAARALHEVVALDAAVTAAGALTDEEDTLTIVTADHSHVFVMAGYPTRGNPILGLVDVPEEESDGKPFTTLLYANGPGYSIINGERENITEVDTTHKDYRQQTAVFIDQETHGGEDVAIFARGPSAHLFHTVHEQNFIAHVLGYAACIGPYSDPENCAAANVKSLDLCRTNTSKAVRLTAAPVLLSIVLLWRMVLMV